MVLSEDDEGKTMVIMVKKEDGEVERKMKANMMMTVMKVVRLKVQGCRQ